MHSRESSRHQAQEQHRSASGLHRIVPTLLVVMAVLIPPLLYIPLHIYTANQYEFSASLYDVIPTLIYLTGALVSASTMLLLLLPPNFHRTVLALGTAFAALFWIQGQLLIRNYGVLDGSAIDWMAWPGRAVFDSLLWISLLAFAFFQRRGLARHAGLLALGLLLIQGVPAAWVTYRYEPPAEFHRYNFSDEKKFAFSPENNVIMIVLDAFQADVFGRLIDDEPELKKDFNGFTWYRNALAGYSKTYPSFALMLSGIWYDNTIPIQSFLKESLVGESVLEPLKDRDWRVDLFPHIKRVLPPFPEIADNIVTSTDCRTTRTEGGKLADLGWFRVSPHPIKSFWLNDYKWRLARTLHHSCGGSANPREESGNSTKRHGAERHAALNFLKQAQNRTQATLQRPGFKLYHLMIPHAPFHLDEQLNLTRLPDTEEGFIRQSRGAIEVVKRFFQALRNRDIYDQSMLVVVSDHGGGEYIGPLAPGSVETAVPSRHMASGLALILVKPPSAQGHLRTSDVPVSLADLAPTIAAESGSGLSFPGRNMFDIAQGVQRERHYRHYAFDGWSGSYLPEMIEYRVDGPSWLVESWSLSRQVPRPGSAPATLENWLYPIGRQIGFRPGSPTNQILGLGWSEADPGGMVWTDGDRAEIIVAIDDPAERALVARFDVLPYTGGGHIDTAHIHLSVNGQIEKQWAVSKRGWISINIPASAAKDTRELRFEFLFPDAASPFELGRSNDNRKLGMALYKMQVRYADESND